VANEFYRQIYDLRKAWKATRRRRWIRRVALAIVLLLVLVIIGYVPWRFIG